MRYIISQASSGSVLRALLSWVYVEKTSKERQRGFTLCFYRTEDGVQLRLGSFFTCTALWPWSLCTLTSAPSAHRVMHLNLFLTLLQMCTYWHSLSLIVIVCLSPVVPHVAPGGLKLRLSSVLSSTPLLPLHADILASLFTPEGQPYLLEVR